MISILPFFKSHRSFSLRESTLSLLTGMDVFPVALIASLLADVFPFYVPPSPFLPGLVVPLPSPLILVPPSPLVGVAFFPFLFPPARQEFFSSRIRSPMSPGRSSWVEREVDSLSLRMIFFFQTKSLSCSLLGFQGNLSFFFPLLRAPIFDYLKCTPPLFL